MTPGSAPAGAGSTGRLAASFAARRGPTGFIPFLTAGYPDPDATFEMVRAVAAAGALAVELGIPFSDPIADGADIQRSSEAAVRAGVSASDVLALVARLRAAGETTLPVVLMTYANPVLRYGLERFARDARAAGADGIIVSDLPPDESPATWDALQAAGLDTIVLVAPTTPADRLPVVLARARGFVYCLARTGVTGSGAGESGPLAGRVAAIRGATALPVAVGFGIASGAQARELAGIADAAIVGAAFIRRITAALASGAPDARGAAIAAVAAFAGELGQALAAP